jgi:hypothetical protein
MRFRLTAIFFATALIGSAIAVLGPGGVVVAAFVLLFWAIVFAIRSGRMRMRGFMGSLLLVLCLLCCAWPFVFALQTYRNAEQCQRCDGNIRQIALAMECYEAQWGCFPPAYVPDENGPKPTSFNGKPKATASSN